MFKKVLFITYISLSIFAYADELPNKYVKEISITPNYHKFIVGDKIQFNYDFLENTDKGNLVFTLLEKCGAESWENKIIQNYPIQDFIFDTPGGCGIQINIAEKGKQDIQRYWVGSFAIKASDIPLNITNRELYLKVSRLLSLMETPEYKNIQIKTYSGEKFKVEQYKIELAKHLDINYAFNFSAHKKKAIALLNEKPTFNDHYNPDLNRKFHPYQWAFDILLLCNLSNKPIYKQRIFKVIPQFIERGNAFSRVQDNAVFYLYPYSRDIYGVELKKGWVSGLSQGYALSAFVSLCEKTQNKNYCHTADKIAYSFFQIRGNLEKQKNRLWVTNVDNNQFLWFQEAPIPGDKQFDILNGHIAAIAGLYSYYRMTHNPEALLFIQAGITTVKRYLADFRNPGHTLRYFLYSPNAADYGPARTIMELKWLSAITGDEYFRKMAEVFTADSQITYNEFLLERY